MKNCKYDIFESLFLIFFMLNDMYLLTGRNNVVLNETEDKLIEIKLQTKSEKDGIK